MLLELVLIAAVSLLSPPDRAETRPSEAKDAPSAVQPAKEAPSPAQLDGLWPSPKLMNLMIARWADEVSNQFELDDEQRGKVREAAAKRWGTFLDENRSTIQPLFNEYVEMRMGLSPPEKEQVQAWAGRAMPVFKQFRGQVNEGADDLREILNPLQRAKFELEALQFGVGMQVAERKLEQWQEGEYEQREVWEPTSSERRRRRSERRQRRREATGDAAAMAPQPDQTDQIAKELTAWEQYVAKFARVYKLDEGQLATARSVLSELKQRAIAHRDRRRDEIAKLERRIETFTGSKEELADLEKQLTVLYGPIDDMFTELKSRIEPIPTTHQRAAVAGDDG